MDKKLIEEYDKGYYEGRRDGIDRGINIERIKTAKKMKLERYPIEEIMKITRLSRQIILDLGVI